MRKTSIGLASIIVPAMAGLFATVACSEDGSNPLTDGAETLCGPCGVVAQGDVGISGSAKLDGFFQAVTALDQNLVTISGEFETNIDSLLATFGTEVAADADIGAKVDALTASIDAELTANVQGGLVVNYVPPRCQANVNIAVEAQAKCEVKGGCTAEVDPGEVSVSCEGTCEGSCEGTCSGGIRCEVSATGECNGSCEGTCQLDAEAACNGTCRGTCSGNCSAYDGEGNCAGQCEGMCTGSCELAVAAECSGSCSGSCVVEAQADCEGEPISCSGSCEGSCSGGCTGTATPPSVAVDCDASADCQAQAKAQASANVECTPPSLDLGFEFAANVDADAQALFTARIKELRVRGVAILQGFAQYEALISGEVNGEVVFDPTPLALITGELQGVVQAGVSGELFADIPVFRAGCAISALQESVTLLGRVGQDAAASAEAQAEFSAALLGG